MSLVPSSASPGEDDPSDRRTSRRKQHHSFDHREVLWSAVRWVLVAVLLFVGAFYLLAVLYSHRGWPWHTAEGYRPPAMYDLARTAATVTGLLGAAVAVAVTLRRQRSTEETVRITAETQKVAAAAQQTTADAYQLDVRRLERQAIDRLRDRYTTIAAQLGHEADQVRLAGVYAMAALADDWLAPGNVNQHEAQTCIDVLCAYLRTPRDTPKGAAERGDLEVRQTITRTIAAHLQGAAAPSWSTMTFDFTGADLRGAHDFGGASFNGRADFTDALFNGRVNFGKASFNGRVDFVGASFNEGSLLNFDGTEFNGHVDFFGAKFNGGSWVDFIRAQFNGQVDFAGALVNEGSQVEFTRAQVNGCIDFTEADFNGMVDFSEASFQGGSVDFTRAHFNGTVKDGEVQVSQVDFSKASLNEGSEVAFYEASFNAAPVGPWPPGNPPSRWPLSRRDGDR